jgi:hypothetical protein
MQKVDITTRYIKEEEVRTNDTPYKYYAKCIIDTFNSEDIDSFCDIECATGHLIYFLKNHNTNIKVKGYEYFKYHKESQYCK